MTSINFSISDALAQVPASGGGAPGLEGLLFPVGLILILYFFVIRPQVKRQKGYRRGLGNATLPRAESLNLLSLFTPRNETNSFSTADRLCDEAFVLLVAKAREAGWEIIEQRSQAYSPNVWFRIDYLLPSPSPDLSLTASVGVDIERFDFHRFEHTFTVKVQVGSRKTKIGGVIALDADAIERIHHHIQRPEKKLKLPNRVRRWPWELWRPLNKIKRLRPDWYTIGLTILAFLLIMIPFIRCAPWRAKRRRVVPGRRRRVRMVGVAKGPEVP